MKHLTPTRASAALLALAAALLAVTPPPGPTEAAPPAPAGVTATTRELARVRDNVARQPGVDWRKYRFLSFSGIADADRPAAKKALRMVLATLTRLAEPAEAVDEVSETLWAVDTARMGWPAGAWEEMSKSWPYYTAAPEALRAHFKEKMGTEFPVMRADVFIDDAWSSRWYEQFLGLPKTREALLDGLGVNVLKPVAMGVAADKLTVTQHPGKVARYQGKGGRAVWVRMNYESQRGEADARKFPARVDCDYNEVAFELPSGFDAYASYDGRTGRLSRFSDTKIARDKDGGVVELGRSCFGCHTNGARKLDHVAGLGDLDLEPRHRKLFDRDRLTEFARKDSDRWVAALRRHAGSTPGEHQAALGAVHARLHADVTADRLARELGVGAAELRRRAADSPVKAVRDLATGKGQPWDRDTFERLLPDAAALFAADDSAYLALGRRR